jgi:IPT/TIG domain
MRNLAFLLASLILIGCGSDHPSTRHPPTVGTAFIVPSITQLSPTSVPVNSAPFTLTVNGSDFGTDALVFWNGAAQHTIFITPKQLIVSVTPADLQFSGPVPLYVRTLGQNSNTVDFEVTPQ